MKIRRPSALRVEPAASDQACLGLVRSLVDETKATIRESRDTILWSRNAIAMLERWERHPSEPVDITGAVLVAGRLR